MSDLFNTGIQTNAGVITMITKPVTVPTPWGQPLRQATYKCFCGNEFIEYLCRIGKSKHSCGCYQQNVRKQGIHKSHGLSKTPEYQAWCEMRRRCNDPNRQNYYLYGGRGIKVCDRWLKSFDNFLEDMGKKPSKEYSLERVNNDSDYSPENCKWADKLEQANNRRNNSHIEVNGIKLTQAQWSRKIGVHADRLYEWNKRGTAIKNIQVRLV